MSTSRFTLGSILTTVSTTANTLTSTISSVGKGAEMLNAFVEKQAKEQAYRYDLEHKVFQETTKVELADQLATSAKTIDAKKHKDPAYAASFDHFYSLLDTKQE
jgi:hypothetical protein